MDNIPIARAALGQSVQLGDLYDARSDTFCGVSLLKRAPPDSALTSQDNPSIRTEFILSDSISNKFEKLDVSGELKVSILAGLFKSEGHGRYLSEERKSARSVSGSLLYSISTKVDSLNVFSEGITECIALNAFNDVQSATHVVVQIGWGANAMLTLDYMNDNREQNRNIGGALQAELKKLAFSIKGKAEITCIDADDSKSTKFTLKVFADVLPHGESVPQTVEEAIAYMKKIPSLVQAANDGKGKPLQFKLLPLSMLENYLKIQNMADRVIHQLDKSSIARVTELFQKIQGVKQQLNDLYRDMQTYHYCIETKDIEEIGNMASALSCAEAGLQSDLGKTLVSVRAGTKTPQDIETLMKSFFESETSPDKITTFIHNHSYIEEKIQYVIHLLMEKVVYIGKGISIDGEKRKNSHESLYVFFYKSADKEVGENKNTFYTLAKEYNSLGVDEPSAIPCMLVDLDVRPELRTLEGVPDGTRICLFMNGRYVVTDVMEKIMRERNFCFVKTSVTKEFVKQKPKNCVDVELVCPNSRLGPCTDERHKWNCHNCKANVEYCVDDKQFYCKCGRAPMDYFIFRCDSYYHGNKYIAYEKEIIEQLMGDFHPLNEVNILLLGETGVGKSTWINAFANYLTFPTLKDAMASDSLYLIPTLFILTDEDGEEHIIRIGEAKEKSFSTDSKLDTKEPVAYVFQVGDMKIRLIDTPGIGNFRGIMQDKINIDKILLYLSNLDELHGICILLQPNNCCLNITLRFCITELLLHLHHSATKNIMFCFTKTSSTFYTPGDTLPLKELLKKFQDDHGVSIPLLQSKTMFCVDNECFRFLCASHNKVDFSGKLANGFGASWDVSVAETGKMIQQILSLNPHQIKETVLLNDARKIILNIDIGRLSSMACDQQTCTSEQLNILWEAAAKFGSFLKTNAIITYNDAFDEYIQLEIELEEAVRNQEKLQSLQHLQTQNKKEAEMLNLAMAASSVVVTTEDVYKLQRDLLVLSKKKADLNNILEEVIFANSDKMHYTENYCPQKYMRQSQNTKKQNNLQGIIFSECHKYR